MSEHQWSRNIQDYEEYEGEIVEGYRPLCGTAVVALLLGLGSFLFLFHSAFCLVPLGGIACGFWALRKIEREEPQPTGRVAALAGIVLAISFLVASPVQAYTFRHLLHEEARQFATVWFERLRDQEPQVAFEMTREPGVRAAIDETLWKTYLSGRAPLDELKNFLHDPAVRALLFLGDKVDIRYRATPSFGAEENNVVFRQIFAATYEDEGQKKTFYMRLLLRRHLVPSTRRAHWAVEEAEFISPTTVLDEAPLEELPDLPVL